MCARLCRPSISWARISMALPTLSWLEMITAWTSYHASVDQLLLPVSFIPIHDKAETSAASTENQAKLSNKGVFVFFSDLLSGFLFCYILIEVILAKSWQNTYYLPEKCVCVGRGAGEDKGILPTWLSSLRIYFKVHFFSKPSPTYISTHLGHSEEQEEWVPVSNTALVEFAAWFHAYNFRYSTWPPFPLKPHYELILIVIYKASKDFKLYNVIRIKICMIKVITHEWVCLSKSRK